MSCYLIVARSRRARAWLRGQWELGSMVSREGRLTTTRLMLVGVLLGLCACATDGGRAVAPMPPVSTETSMSPSTTVAPTTSPPCPPGGPLAQGEIGRIGDVDGDGAGDEVYLYRTLAPDQELVVGVRTASGTTSETGMIVNIISAVSGSADVNGDGREEIFLRANGNTGTGGQVAIGVFADCRLELARNIDGETYTFQFGGAPDRPDVVFTSGLGCVDTDGDGRTELVALSQDEEGDTVSWTRTVVHLTQAGARNGSVDHGTYTRPEDQDEIALLNDVTCGDVTFPNIQGELVAGDGRGAVS